MIRVIFVSFGCFISLYSKMIGWVIEGKEICYNARWSGYPRGSSLVEVYELLLGEIIFFQCSIKVNILWCSVVENICHGVAKNGGIDTLLSNCFGG